ncbi:uncharacterized protein LOC144702348 [Wolffia australiana]
MEVALAAPRYPFSSSVFKVTRHRNLGSCPSRSLRFHRLSKGCYIQAQTADHFSERNNVSAHLHSLSEALWKSLPQQVREFPWKEAEAVATQRLLHLGREALKVFLLVGFFLSFTSDLVFSFLRSKELVIPLGLTIGVMAADLLMETAKELHYQANDYGKTLLGVGSVFVCAKVFALCFDLPGRMVLAHVGNGGLMQLLWLWKQAKGSVANDDQP